MLNQRGNSGYVGVGHLALCSAVLCIMLFPEAVGENEKGSSAKSEISHPLPDGTELHIQAPQPKLPRSNDDVLSTRRIQTASRSITFEKVKPLSIPPFEKPETKRIREDESVPANLPESESAWEETRIVFVGAQVFRAKNGKALSLIRYASGNKREEIYFWSSANWEKLTGIGSFTDKENRHNALLMAVSVTEVDDFSEILELAEAPAHLLPLPLHRKNGEASFSAPEADAEKLAPIRALHEIYNRDKAKLEAAARVRKLAAAVREAELRANPPDEKPMVLRYWQIEKPIATTPESETPASPKK